MPISSVAALRFLQDIIYGGEQNLKSLDRESLLVVHQILTTLRDEVEQELLQSAAIDDSGIEA
ncbi:hypothetical protein [Hyphomicrobium sp.]|uniref:hypothetical protein n=1 Tax=Hyphomicrobium sp. TaxID=82 RepID=UPI002B916AF4|nr:hypothetical protein [Hyphomicrobium sp.]HVZ03327.1 hypothetical protein [Hyphomicrobium sp.]